MNEKAALTNPLRQLKLEHMGKFFFSICILVNCRKAIGKLNVKSGGVNHLTTSK